MKSTDPPSPSSPLRVGTPLRRAPRRVVQFEISRRGILTVFAIAAAAWMVTKLVAVLLVLVVALMMVGALNPLVARLEARHVGRRIAIAIVFTLTVAGIGLLAFLTIPPLIAQVASLIDREPKIRGELVEWLSTSPLTSALADQLRDVKYQQLFDLSGKQVLSTTRHVFELVALGIGSVFLAIYIMLDRDRLRGAVFAIVPRQHHVRLSRVLLNLERIVGGYIRGQVFTSLLIAIFMFVVLTLCHVPDALALSVFGGIADVLPYIGPLLTIAPAVIAAYAEGPAIAATVFVLLVLYEEFEGRILLPLVYGRALRLPSSVVFFALLMGAALGGIAGALLALPIAAAVLMLIDELRVELPGETMQPEDVEALRKDRHEVREYERRAAAAPAAESSAIAVEIARERSDDDKNGETREDSGKTGGK